MEHQAQTSAARRNVQITRERNLELRLSNPDDQTAISLIGKALSSPLRIRILNHLRNRSNSLQEIAARFQIPLSSAAMHIQKLEDAGLVVTETQPGLHGQMRVCTCSLHSLRLETIDPALDSINKTLTMDMPVGSYYACEATPTCGLADENGPIDAYDAVRSFYSPVRSRAQLLWFHTGFVEYRFPNIHNPHLKLKELSFRLELCSEAPGYLEKWPSDIQVSINGQLLGIYTSPGDYGDRRGKLTPPCWPNGNTQYGLLKTFSVKETGCFIDHAPVNSSLTLADLKLDAHPYIGLRLTVSEDAEHVGGLNIFGSKYGDYPQGIVMNLSYL